MLPVTIKKDRFDGMYHASLAETEHYRSGFLGKGKTKTDAQTALHDAILQQADEQGRRAYIFTNSPDGTIVCVHYNEGWQYDMVSADQSHVSSCLFSAKNFTDASRIAIHHVENGFGGVKAIVR